MSEPVEIQAHYLSLVTEAVEAADGFCMIRAIDQSSGAIFVSRSSTETKADYYIQFSFNEGGVKLGVRFTDARPEVVFSATYLDGIDGFFPLFLKALKANRLEHRDGVTGSGIEIGQLIDGNIPVFVDGAKVGEIWTWSSGGFCYASTGGAPGATFATLDAVKAAVLEGRA